MCANNKTSELQSNWCDWRGGREILSKRNKNVSRARAKTLLVFDPICLRFRHDLKMYSRLIDAYTDHCHLMTFPCAVTVCVCFVYDSVPSSCPAAERSGLDCNEKELWTECVPTKSLMVNLQLVILCRSAVILASCEEVYAKA